MKINVWHSTKNTQSMHSLTSGVHNSKHTYVPMADIYSKANSDRSKWRKDVYVQ